MQNGMRDMQRKEDEGNENTKVCAKTYRQKM